MYANPNLPVYPSPQIDLKNSMIKTKDISLPAKVCLVKAVVFPVVMCGCESWTVRKAELQRIDAFFVCLFCFELMLLTCGVGEDS